MYEYRGGSPAYKSDYTDYNVNKKPVTNSEYGTVKGSEYSTVKSGEYAHISPQMCSLNFSF